MKLNTTLNILWLPELDVFAAPAAAVFDMSELPYWLRIQDAPFLPHTGWLAARPIVSQDAMEAYVEVAAGKPLCITSGAQFMGQMYLTPCIQIFKPAAPVDEAVNTALGQIIGRTVVGVHYRKGLASISPPSAFWRAMRATADAQPNVLFYVASDDPAFVEAAVLQFPGQTTVGFKQAKDANNPEGNEQAAIDFFALARTTMILGSSGSGFGGLAATYGGIPYVDVIG